MVMAIGVAFNTRILTCRSPFDAALGAQKSQAPRQRLCQRCEIIEQRSATLPYRHSIKFQSAFDKFEQFHGLWTTVPGMKNIDAASALGKGGGDDQRFR